MFDEWTARIEHGARDPQDTSGFEAFMEMGVSLMDLMPTQVDSDTLIGVERVDIDGHITGWGGYGVTTVRYYNRHAPILSNFRLGDVLPLMDSAAGRIFLTHLSERMTRPILKAEIAKSEERKLPAEEIDRIKQFIRTQGYAWIDGQVFHSIRAIAVPIFDSQGEIQAAISLVSNRASLVQFPNPTLDDLIQTGERISFRLGWKT